MSNLKSNQKKIKLVFYLTITIILTLGLSISFQALLAAWTPPTASPPLDNTAKPINEGTDGQKKQGSFGTMGNLIAGSRFYMGLDENSTGDLYLADRIVDWDDGDYYIDPDGTSVFNTIDLDGIERSSWPTFTDTNNYTNGVSFNTQGDGILTLTRQGLGSLTVDLDDRYLTSFSESDPQVEDLESGKWCTSDGSVVNCTSDTPSLADTNASTICLGSDVLNGSGSCVSNYDGVGITSESDTLQTVTSRTGGASTNKSISVAGLTVAGTGTFGGGYVKVGTNSNAGCSSTKSSIMLAGSRIYDACNGNLYLYPGGGSNYTVVASGNFSADKKISAGSTGHSYYPGGGNWDYTLQLNGSDYTSIGFHDSGNSVSSIRYYNKNFYIGYEDHSSWGTADVNIGGALCLGGDCRSSWPQLSIVSVDATVYIPPDGMKHSGSVSCPSETVLMNCGWKPGSPAWDGGERVTASFDDYGPYTLDYRMIFLKRGTVSDVNANVCTVSGSHNDIGFAATAYNVVVTAYCLQISQ